MEISVKKSCLFAIMIAASAAASAPAQAEDVAKSEGAAPPAEKKICRTEQVTGSLARRNRICMTKAEWDRLAAETQKNVGDLQSRQNRTPQQSSSPFGP